MRVIYWRSVIQLMLEKQLSLSCMLCVIQGPGFGVIGGHPVPSPATIRNKPSELRGWRNFVSFLGWSGSVLPCIGAQQNQETQTEVFEYGNSCRLKLAHNVWLC